MEQTKDSNQIFKPAYTQGEEIASGVIHGIGIALSSAGLAMMIVFATMFGNGWHIATSIVYGISLILLYTASTLYHSLTNERAKHIFKILDHSSIFLLIAGTYTPFSLVTLRGPWGWGIFATVWTLAVAGLITEAFWVYRPKWISVVLYTGMGWIVIFAIKPLLVSMAKGGLILLFAGGIVYTLGTVFYVQKKIKYMHSVWHCFVLAGSILHFLAIFIYVIP
ncbi:hemolysin III family protein [Myxococcota bacterium]|nr:hemolysin III family protein [Myxococcota bacterium]MBU1379665.1 hemolysin III family protein [Myxococcota bacterium]MBU1497494.1 hemolysin III family protein [Myxococcota bacterium]